MKDITKNDDRIDQLLSEIENELNEITDGVSTAIDKIEGASEMRGEAVEEILKKSEKAKDNERYYRKMWLSEKNANRELKAVIKHLAAVIDQNHLV